MMAIKYKENTFRKYLREKWRQALRRSKEANKKGIKIIVKPGSTLPTDKQSQREDAIELAKANRISDVDFFKMMDMANPREMAKNLFLQTKYPERLYPDLMKDIRSETEKDTKKGTVNPPMADATAPPQPGPAGEIMQAIMGGGQAPGIPGQTPQSAIPGQAALSEEPAAEPPVQGVVPTEHTERLLAGEQVPPFDGIEPSEEHVAAEFAFMGSDEFAQLPEEIQAIYAQHAMK